MGTGIADAILSATEDDALPVQARIRTRGILKRRKETPAEKESKKVRKAKATSDRQTAREGHSKFYRRWHSGAVRISVCRQCRDNAAWAARRGHPLQAFGHLRSQMRDCACCLIIVLLEG